MQFKIITFGCKLNQAESDQISTDLILAEFEPIKKKQQPDFIILNVCAVTHKAVREARQKVAHLKRQHPSSKIIVTGCIDEDDWPGVDAWVRNKDKIVKEIKKFGNLEIGNVGAPLVGAQRDEKMINDLSSRAATRGAPTNRTRAFIKIQDGCDNFCSYCIVPFMRRLPKSKGVEEIIKDVQDKGKQGYKEVVLTGVNIGLYAAKKEYPGSGYPDLGSSFFLPELLKIILKNTNIPRIRLSSLWPTHLASQLINLIAKNPRICPHLHLSIQSSSNKILKFMDRQYTVQDIIKITNQAKKKIPKINFTCDLIVGFPSETDQDFQASCQLIEKVSFSKVHVFKYSPRPKTKAAKMQGQVADKVKQARSKELIKLADQTAKKVKASFVGQESNVLWEEKKGSFWYGYTDNYIRVRKRVEQKESNNLVEHIKIKKSMVIY